MLCIRGRFYRVRKNSLRRARLQPCRKCRRRYAALAAEVRFGCKALPQELKPSSILVRCGTAEAVPFVESFFAASSRAVEPIKDRARVTGVCLLFPHEGNRAYGQLFTKLVTLILPSPVAKSQPLVARYASSRERLEVESMPYPLGEGS
jgi:hypothetical protein